MGRGAEEGAPWVASEQAWEPVQLGLYKPATKPGETDTGGSLGTSGSQSRQDATLQIRQETLSHKIRWGVIEKDTQHRPSASKHVHNTHILRKRSGGVRVYAEFLLCEAILLERILKETRASCYQERLVGII